MIAVMIPASPVLALSATLTMWLFAGLFVAALGLVAAWHPVQARKLAGAFGLSLMLAGVIVVPQVIIRCPTWWCCCAQ